MRQNPFEHFNVSHVKHLLSRRIFSESMTNGQWESSVPKLILLFYAGNLYPRENETLKFELCFHPVGTHIILNLPKTQQDAPSYQ